MTIKTYTTQTKQQIQVLMLKLKLIQTLLLEKLEETMRLPTTLIFQEDLILFSTTTVLMLSEKLQTDGKETQTILDQLKQLDLRQTELLKLRLLLLFKRKLIQMLLSEKPEETMRKLTMLISQEDQISFSITTELLS